MYASAKLLSVVSDSLRPHGLQPTRLLCPWNSPGKNTEMGCHFLLQRIFPTQGSNPYLLFLLHWQVGFCRQSHLESPKMYVCVKMKVNVSHQCLTLVAPWTIQSMEFSRPEYWSGQPFPSPGDLPNLVIKPRSTTLQVDSFSFFFYFIF